MQGLFITLEGPEGAGKTTIMNRLAKDLIEQGVDVVPTREPGGIHIAEEIRKVILDKSNTAMDARTEALLYAAARSQHLAEKVLPALESGSVVLCDRFIDSSLAYQGHARGLGIDEIFAINQFAIQDVMPDLTLYFDIDPQLGLQRIEEHTGREVNRLDLEKLDFHHKVRAGYKKLLDTFPERIVQIDASDSFDDVFDRAKKIVEELLLKEGKLT